MQNPQILNLLYVCEQETSPGRSPSLLYILNLQQYVQKPLGPAMNVPIILPSYQNPSSFFFFSSSSADVLSVPSALSNWKPPVQTLGGRAAPLLAPLAWTRLPLTLKITVASLGAGGAARWRLLQAEPSVY